MTGEAEPHGGAVGGIQARCREGTGSVGRGLGKGRRPGFPEAAARLFSDATDVLCAFELSYPFFKTT